MPKRWMTTSAYVSQSDAEWFACYRPESVEIRPAIHYGAQAPSFLTEIEPALPELGLLKIPNGFLLGPDGLLATPAGTLLPEYSWQGANFEEPSVLTDRFEVTRLKGSCLFLSSDWSYSNYAHFLNDAIPRLHLFEKAGFALTDINYFFCGIPNRFCAALVSGLGIPLDRCVLARPGAAITADMVLVPSLPGTRRIRPRWVVDFLRQRFLRQLSAPFRRIYISRTGSRRIVNEAEIVDILAPNGFEIYYPERDEDQPRTFSEAEIVIAAHGAALANLAFCQPGTSVIELIPSNKPSAYRYHALSSAGDLIYARLIGTPHSEEIPTSSASDFHVDADEFRAALHGTLESEGGLRQL